MTRVSACASCRRPGKDRLGLSYAQGIPSAKHRFIAQHIYTIRVQQPTQIHNIISRRNDHYGVRNSDHVSKE